MAQIILTLYDYSDANDRSKKFLIEPDLIAYTETKTFETGKITCVYFKEKLFNIGSCSYVFETPEEIAELIASSTAVPTPSKFIKLHVVQRGDVYPICLNMDKIEKIYPKDNETFHGKLPDSLSPENVDKARLTVIHYQIGSSSNYYEFLERYDYICRMLSAK